jgi:hypothetical protein
MCLFANYLFEGGVRVLQLEIPFRLARVVVCTETTATPVNENAIVLNVTVENVARFSYQGHAAVKVCASASLHFLTYFLLTDHFKAHVQVPGGQIYPPREGELHFCLSHACSDARSHYHSAGQSVILCFSSELLPHSRLSLTLLRRMHGPARKVAAL